jgi:DNA-binding MarR family transcriptional regulator
MLAMANPVPQRLNSSTNDAQPRREGEAPRWSETHADAWVGLLQAHRQLTRELDDELEGRYALSLSALELLGRLAAADDRWLRLSTLADQAGLSLSRVSRIVDALESRGLVARRPCPGDRRAINAVLTDAGLSLAREAQASHFAAVQRLFFDALSPAEVAMLAAVFKRFAPQGAQDCTRPA